MNKEKKEINYLSLLILGISLVSVGLIFFIAINPAFVSLLGAGVGLVAIALAKREKKIKF